MTALPPNAFIGSRQKPADAALAAALGSAKPAWDQLIASLAADHGVTIQEWKSYSAKAGWSLRLLRGKRTIVWLAPCEGCFRVAFILGEKAVAAARQGGVPAPLLRLIDEAEKYPEGTGIRLHVKALKDLPAVKKLAEIKLAN